MSACISSHGEFSEHEMDETGFACLHCGFDDIEAMCARIAQLEAAVEERCGWRPPAQVIETAEDLAAVKRGTIVHNSDGTIACRFDEQYGVVFGDDRPFPWSILTPPATVVWSPTEKVGTE